MILHRHTAYSLRIQQVVLCCLVIYIVFFATDGRLSEAGVGRRHSIKYNPVICGESSVS